MKDYDPFDAAMSDEPEMVYGLLTTDAFLGLFLEGQRGAVPYDENAHGHLNKRPYPCIRLIVTPLDPTRQVFEDDYAKFFNQYQNIVRPSLVAMTDRVAQLKNLTEEQFNVLKELNGMYVKCARAPYKSKSKDGSTEYNRVAHKLIEVYTNENECAIAFESETGQSATPEPIPFESPPVEADPERTTFATFLPALWSQAQNQATANGSDAKDELVTILAANPMLAVHFTIDSPEVKEVMTK